MKTKIAAVLGIKGLYHYHLAASHPANPPSSVSRLALAACLLVMLSSPSLQDEGRQQVSTYEAAPGGAFLWFRIFVRRGDPSRESATA